MAGFFGALKHEGKDWNEEEEVQFRNSFEGLTYYSKSTTSIFRDEHMRFGILDNLGSDCQPFIFGGNRYALIVNGTIYNGKQLREMLEYKNYLFETNSVEEVIANLFLAYGVDSFRDLRGMFAIIIWDNEEKLLYGVRDFFGIKPFYYSDQADFLFSSEKQPILTYVADLPLHEQALVDYFSFQYVPTPMTLTEGISSLEPGHYFMKKKDKPLEKHRYFHATLKPVYGNENLIISRIQEVMVESVSVHLPSGVPAGVLLSGGIDSSFLVGIAKQINPSIKTISVGFEDEDYSELPIAQQTAAELGVENIAYTISPREYIEALPSIIKFLEEPLADPACVPLYIAAREARKHVEVVLSGEGADEFFGGYNIYREFESLRFFNYVPSSVQRMLHWLAEKLPDGMVGKSFLQRGTTPLQERYIGNAKIFEEKEKACLLLPSQKSQSYRHITDELFSLVKGQHPTHQMQYIDIHTWLPGDILLKADRMMKANLLELRTPFLDKEVFEVARRIPVDYKITDGTTKAIFRKAAQEFVPPHVVNRRKLGFPVPIRKWLQEELVEWAKDVIRESQTEYILNKSYVLSLLEEHVNHKRDHSRKLWAVLIFMLWHKEFIEKTGK
jgi:asparagine synthase (glutamine-hydrolysing)